MYEEAERSGHSIHPPTGFWRMEGRADDGPPFSLSNLVYLCSGLGGPWKELIGLTEHQINPPQSSSQSCCGAAELCGNTLWNTNSVCG